MEYILNYINSKVAIMLESGILGILLLLVIALAAIFALRVIIHVLIIIIKKIAGLLFRRKPVATEVRDDIGDGSAEKLFAQGLARERRGDITGAISSYEAATTKPGGHPMASFNLANLYFNGEGNGRRNPVAAVKHFRKAAMSGIAPAMDALAQAYQYGEGVVADPAKAYIWCLVAKAAGVKSAGERQLRYETMLLKDHNNSQLRSWRGEAAALFDKINK